MATLAELQAQQKELREQIKAAKAAEKNIDRAALQAEYQTLFDAQCKALGVDTLAQEYQAIIEQGKATFDKLIAAQQAAKDAVLTAKPLPGNVHPVIHSAHYATNKQGVNRPVFDSLTIEIPEKRALGNQSHKTPAKGFKIDERAESLATTDAQKKALDELRAMGKAIYHIKDLKAASGRTSGFKATDWRWIVPVYSPSNTPEPVKA